MQSMVIKGILEDELERTKRMLRVYSGQYEALRKGSIYMRTVGNKQYCYLNYREGNRVVSEYIGIAGSEKVEKIKAEVAERKRIKQTIKTLKMEQKEIEKAIR